MPVVVKFPLLIDRISLVDGIESGGVYGSLMSKLENLHNSASIVVPVGKLTQKYGKVFQRVGFYPAKSRKIADIQVGANKNGQRYFKLNLYHPKMVGGEFAHFCGVLQKWFPKFTYHDLWLNGHVTHIELAADCSVPMYTFIPHREKVFNSHIFKNSGQLGTIYIGKIGSKRMLRVYDKHKQLLETKSGTPKYHTQTRIELRWKPDIYLEAGDLAHHPNPLSVFEMADAGAAAAISSEPAWKQFLWRCQADGACAALGDLDSPQRKLFRMRLREAAAAWWNPAEVWSGIGKAVAAIAPPSPGW